LTEAKRALDLDPVSPAILHYVARYIPFAAYTCPSVPCAENVSEFERSFEIMAIYRIIGAFRLFACALLICAAVVRGPRTSFAQTTDSTSEPTQNAEPRSGTLGFSDQARENQPPPRAQEAVTDTGCSVREFFHDTWSGNVTIWPWTQSCSPRCCSSQQFEMGAAYLGGHRCIDRKGRPAS
jgi:hypothetical protein